MLNLYVNGPIQTKEMILAINPAVPKVVISESEMCKSKVQNVQARWAKTLSIPILPYFVITMKIKPGVQVMLCRFCCIKINKTKLEALNLKLVTR